MRALASTGFTVLPATLRIAAGATVVQTAVLTTALAWANAPLPALAAGELAAAMLWIAAVSNAALLAALSLLWLALRRLLAWSRDDWPAYLISGFVAGHLVWGLLNRLTRAQSWILPPRFLTLPGLVDLATILLAGACILVSGVWLRRRGRRRRSAVLLAFAVALAAVCLAWNMKTEVQDRRYPVEEIRRAAGSTGGEPPGTSLDESRRVILLGLDGLSWNLMKPLLAAGRLPNFARLIRSGACGYLDNGDLSLSPLIWNTVFTGRPPEEHGVLGFRKMTLPFSGRAITELLTMPPTLHTFHGMKHLAELPNPGLWTMNLTGSADRKVRTVWEVASGFGRRVAVANPVTSLPVRPVRGSAIVYSDDGKPTSAFPAELAAQWARLVARSGRPRIRWRRAAVNPRALIERARLEAAFTLDLFSRGSFDLGVYCNRLADDLLHLRWAFHAQDRILLTSLPASLDDREWERLVDRHAGDPVIGSYVELDRILGELLARFPCNYVVVSDHGWTFSGYQHYGAPDGIVILSGPAFRAGVNLKDAHILDIAPTLLSLLGVPLSHELRGCPLAEAMRIPPRPGFVPTYGRPAPLGEPVRVEDLQELERLKSLGYLR